MTPRRPSALARLSIAWNRIGRAARMFVVASVDGDGDGDGREDELRRRPPPSSPSPSPFTTTFTTTRSARLRSALGFSLLEVLMAVALFGAVVTTILSAQAGLVSGDRTAANMSQAAVLGRCRMSELEEKQLKLGFPEIEEKDTSTVCCDDKEVPGFSCDWKVERVTLPQVTSLGGDGGATSVFGGGLGLDAGMMGTGLPSNLGNLAGSLGTMVNPAGGAQLDLDAGLQNIGQSLQQSFGGGGATGLLSMAFSIVYPSLKPLLESGIRRVTVTIHWKEGSTDRDFTLMQYVTNPSRAGLLASMLDAGAVGEGGAPANSGGLFGGLGGAGPSMFGMPGGPK